MTEVFGTSSQISIRKIKGFSQWVFFGLGLGATSPLLAIVTGGRVISLMTIALIFSIIILLINYNTSEKNLQSTKLLRLFLLWMGITIIASAFGFVYFVNIDTAYSFSAIKYIPKILLYIVFLLLLIKNKKRQVIVSLILEGIFIGISINLLWSIVDAALYYTTHKSLTNMLFQSYIVAMDMPNGLASIVDGFTIRSTGLNNDPATIGFFATIGSAFSFATHKRWILYVCILASLACVSFVGLTGIFLVMIYQFFQIRNKLKAITIAFFILVLIVIIFSLLSNIEIVQDVQTAVELRANSKLEGDHSSATRMLFLTKFFNAIMNMPTSLLLGTGYSTGVFPYYPEGLDYGHAPHPTTMENTYIDNFFSFGLIGFIFFIWFTVKMLTSSKKMMQSFPSQDSVLIYSISLATLISYAFYHYTLYSVIMLASICAIIFLGSTQRIGIECKNCSTSKI